MRNLYLLTEKNLELANLVCNESSLILLRDAIYLLTEPSEFTKTLDLQGVETYVFEADARERGIEDAVPSYIQRIDYPELVQLIMDKDSKIINL